MTARIVVCLVTSVLIALAFSGCDGGRMPKDAVMLGTFSKQRNEMDALRKMVESDTGLKRVDNDWTNPDDPATIGVSADRIADYRARFRRLGITRGFEAFGGPEHIQFMVWVQGLAIAGSAKGYVWSIHQPDSIVSDLDEVIRKNVLEHQKMERHEPNNWEKHLDLYRRIDGNWYLHFEN